MIFADAHMKKTYRNIIFQINIIISDLVSAKIPLDPFRVG